VEIQLRKLERLLGDRKIRVEVSPEAKKFLAEEGYDPAFGARPLKRTIQSFIQNPLALALLEGKYGEGDRIRVVPDGNGKLAFEKGT
jgi:ATP-dependent Clp protease ATP-binding subunit ClpB